MEASCSISLIALIAKNPVSVSPLVFQKKTDLLERLGFLYFYVPVSNLMPYMHENLNNMYVGRCKNTE